MFARFDENPAMTLQDIKETQRYWRTQHGRTNGRTDNVKTVYPPQNSIPSTKKVFGGYNKVNQPVLSSPSKWLQNLKDIKYWITKQGPKTETPQIMSATINRTTALDWAVA